MKNSHIDGARIRYYDSTPERDAYGYSYHVYLDRGKAPDGEWLETPLGELVREPSRDRSKALVSIKGDEDGRVWEKDEAATELLRRYRAEVEAGQNHLVETVAPR